MSPVTRRKVQVNSTMSPILAKKIDEGVESGKYSSQSDYVSIAVAEHSIREEQREKEKKMAELYSVLIQHEEGRKLLNEVPRTTKEKVEALTKAGIAHVEAGEYEEAKKCFAKAKELEEKQKEEPLQNPSNHRVPTPEEQRKAKENLRALDEHLAKEHNTTPLYKIDELAAKIKPISEELEEDEIPRETVRRGVIE